MLLIKKKKAVPETPQAEFRIVNKMPASKDLPAPDLQLASWKGRKLVPI
jgi:hypothetical protein